MTRWPDGARVAPSEPLAQNEGVSGVNDPQIWSLVGLLVAFGAAILGMLRFNNRSVERMIDGLDRSLSAKVEGLSSDVGHRLDNLQRDLTLIKGHLLEQQRSA